jgi:hypothetical protein
MAVSTSMMQYCAQRRASEDERQGKKQVGQSVHGSRTKAWAVARPGERGRAEGTSHRTREDLARENENEGARLSNVVDQLGQIAKIVRVEEDDLVLLALLLPAVCLELDLEEPGFHGGLRLRPTRFESDHLT